MRKQIFLTMAMVLVIAMMATGCATLYSPVTKRMDETNEIIRGALANMEGSIKDHDKQICALNVITGKLQGTPNIHSRLTAIEKALEQKADKAYVDQKTKGTKNQGLVSRVARLEDVVSYVHPNVLTDSVNTFKSGVSDLSEVAKTYLDKIVERVNTGEVAIKQIIGYSDLSPASKGTTNQDIARHRAETVAQYLKEKGLDLSSVLVRGADATDRYGYGRAEKKKNRRATVILEKLTVAPATTPAP